MVVVVPMSERHLPTHAHLSSATHPQTSVDCSLARYYHPPWLLVISVHKQQCRQRRHRSACSRFSPRESTLRIFRGGEWWGTIVLRNRIRGKTGRAGDTTMMTAGGKHAFFLLPFAGGTSGVKEHRANCRTEFCCRRVVIWYFFFGLYLKIFLTKEATHVGVLSPLSPYF